MALHRTLMLLSVPLAAALVVPACGSDTATTSADGARTFHLDEWSITAPATPLEAGKIRLTVINSGHETHELVIVRAHDTTPLPTKTNGAVDEDQIPGGDKMGEIADLAAGKSASKTFDLPAGHYVAFCNIEDASNSHMGSGGMGSGGMGNGSGMGGSGTGGMGQGSGMNHVHYRLGMVTRFTVT